MRFPAGADAVDTLEQKANSRLAQANAHRELSSNLAHDDAWNPHSQRPHISDPLVPMSGWMANSSVSHPSRQDSSTGRISTTGCARVRIWAASTSAS